MDTVGRDIEADQILGFKGAAEKMEDNTIIRGIRLN